MIDFKDLDAWKASRKLVNDIYSASKTFPTVEQFGLTLQIRKAAVSVPSNIAEGIGRNHTKDTLQFLYISRGSLFELETQLIIALDQQFIAQTQFDGIAAN
jgi:four helix bundle protein